MSNKVLVLIAALVIAAVPLSAQTHEVGASIGTADVPVRVFGDISAVGAHYNHFWTRNISTKFTLTRYLGDFEPDTFTAGELEMNVWSAAAQYHVVPGRLFSPYVAAGGAYVTSTLSDTAVGSIEADGELTPLVGGGIDVNITPRFSFGVDATYFPALTVEFPPVAEVGMDPLTWSAGVKFRW